MHSGVLLILISKPRNASAASEQFWDITPPVSDTAGFHTRVSSKQNSFGT